MAFCLMLISKYFKIYSGNPLNGGNLCGFCAVGTHLVFTYVKLDEIGRLDSDVGHTVQAKQMVITQVQRQQLKQSQVGE